MQINLDETALSWQQKARDFAEKALIPWEVEAEMNEGRLPGEISKQHREKARDLGFSSMDVAKSYGGLELRTVDQVAAVANQGK